jgi:hypothetical protein
VQKAIDLTGRRDTIQDAVTEGSTCAAVEAAPEAAGYALLDVSRILVTHAPDPSDGAYEWYATGDAPLEAGQLFGTG